MHKVWISSRINYCCNVWFALDWLGLDLNLCQSSGYVYYNYKYFTVMLYNQYWESVSGWMSYFVEPFYNFLSFSIWHLYCNIVTILSICLLSQLPSCSECLVLLKQLHRIYSVFGWFVIPSLKCHIKRDQTCQAENWPNLTENISTRF